jgi:tetratricopeptide (TPR) repeat protein
MPSTNKRRKALSTARKVVEHSDNTKSGSAGIKSNVEEFDSKAFRAYIECDGCGQRNPAHKCSRCKCAFYCSTACQRQHWNREHKKACIPFEKRVPVIPQMEESLVIPLNSECGICFEEPIKQPVVLQDCRHAFCFPCLKSWQGDSKNVLQDGVWEMLGQTEKVTKFCPTCRNEIGKSVAQDALIKANIYQAQAKRLPQSAGEAERMRLLHLAVSECDKVFETDPDDLDTLKIKLRALVQFDPSETIRVVKRLLQLHELVNPKACRLQEQVSLLFAAYARGDEEDAKSRYEEIKASYGCAEPWPRSLGSRPDATFPFRVMLAKAYEELNEIPDAYREYDDMMKWYQDYEDNTGTLKTSHDDLSCIRDITMGFSRCTLALGDFDNALCSGQHVLLMGRNSAGAHMLVAKAQRALARPPSVTVHSMTGGTNKLTSTLADAVETMYRGVVYETPWDENKQRVNREFLQELLDEIGDEGR